MLAVSRAFHLETTAHVPSMLSVIPRRCKLETECDLAVSFGERLCRNYEFCYTARISVSPTCTYQLRRVARVRVCAYRRIPVMPIASDRYAQA